MIEYDREKNWTDAHKLTDEELKKLIDSKAERAKVQQKAVQTVRELMDA
jgi:hypothetical protein